MRKEVIKCDFCGRELENKEEDSEYYEIKRMNIQDWMSYTGTMRDYLEKKEICSKCAEIKKISF